MLALLSHGDSHEPLRAVESAEDHLFTLPEPGGIRARWMPILAALFLAALTLSSARAAVAGGDETPPLRLRILDCGSFHSMDAAPFYRGVAEHPDRIDLVNHCFLIQHPKGTLIWDTGLPHTFFARVMSAMLWLTTFGRSTVTPGRPLNEELAELGLSPADVRGRDQIGGMWRMLCDTIRTKGRDAWKLDASGITADASTGRAHWEARYRFSATGRLVHNVVDARFTFRGGLIATHRDTFDFWRWSRQALGPAGVVLGWTLLVRRKVRAQAASSLSAFTRKSH